MELIGLYLVACALLVVAGTAKAYGPSETAHALAPLIPLDEALVRRTVRVGAVVEAVLGVAAIVYPHTLLAAAVAASYGVFAAFVAYARARGGAIASCGCFGTPDTPATGTHVVVNLVLCVSAISVAGVAHLPGRLGSGRAPGGTTAHRHLLPDGVVMAESVAKVVSR
jgi:Methylamine utilisation protein MauE